jgi:heme-degrading monooxygenase HmoA
MRDAMVDLPWQSLHPPEREREYLALLSYLPLKRYRTMIRFSRHVRRIQRQLATAPGLIGYSLRAKLLRHRFWTLSVWEDDAALNAFVRADPHRTTMGALQTYMDETAFLRWTIAGSKVPPSWDEAMRRSADAAAKPAP